MSIYITAIIKSKFEYVKEITAVLQHMITETKKESACIQYDLYQGKEDKNIFVFYEIWKNQKGLDSHNQQSYILEFKHLIKEKLQEDPVIYLTKRL